MLQPGLPSKYERVPQAAREAVDRLWVPLAAPEEAVDRLWVPQAAASQDQSVAVP